MNSVSNADFQDTKTLVIFKLYNSFSLHFFDNHGHGLNVVACSLADDSININKLRQLLAWHSIKRKNRTLIEDLD
ncbi:hypothetical protein BpHYR1_015707 [Brachionus plicatilis]|uniref:Uncharacterized protein n=1 Tax=Brachionus plicatilis TaxID=10195 RepID=A0A3M7RGI2_BRAPC|nr:hypothetical protein BpHYR1_015707 [Brachionus plicatilis]